MAKPYTPPESPEALKEAARLREVMQLEARVNSAYSQRNNAAVALVRMALLLGWPAGRGLDDLTDNAPEWRHVVYLDLPNGEQVSYHMAPADVPLLDGLPEYPGKWDGKFTGTTAWAEMVPAPDAAWRALLERETDHAAQVMGEGDFDPEELGDPDSERTLSPSEHTALFTRAAWPEGGPDYDVDEIERLMQGVPGGETVLTLPFRADMPVPKEPFKPGVCACPKCEQPREVGKLFCAPHRRVDSRIYASLNPLTNERLAYMMQRDGEQQ